VLVKAGSAESVSIKLPVKELAYYDVAAKKWVVEAGKYTLKVGNSSRDIKKEIVVTIK
jgi:beta-glucosidase